MVRGTIAASGQPGVWAEAAEAVFTHNEISAHAGASIQNSGPAIDARRNWWGDASGPKHPTLNPGGTGGTVSNGVRFDPWLDRYTWLEPAKPLLHGVEPLSWRGFGVEPASLSVDAYAADGSSILVLGSSLPGSAATVWDTRQAADGPYELRAVFREGGGGIAAEAVLPVVVNNDAAIEWHGGRVTGMEVWSAARLHVVESDVIVGAGAHLVIEPGAVVKFLPGTRLIVESGGVADALATPEAPIVLTSIGDDTAGGDTNGDGDATAPAPGDWRWIHVDGAEALFEHVELRYGAGTVSGGWDQTGMRRPSGAATLTVRSSVLRDALFDGILAWGGPVTVENSILANIDRAVAAHPGSPVEVIHCTLDGNRIGPWHDTVNLVYRPQASPEVIFAAEVLVGQGKRLGPGRSLAVSAAVRVPGSVVGEHRWLVVANTRAEVFEGANRANNATLSVAPVALDLPELVAGAAPLSRVFDAAREPHWF